MSTIANTKNIASLIQPVVASATTSVTAAGSGDNTVVTGLSIDRSLYNMPQSVQWVLAYQTTVASAQTLLFKNVLIEDSADNGSWATFLTYTDPGVVETGVVTNKRSTVNLAANLTAARQYIRLKWTPDMSASGTDTATIVAIANLGGTAHRPAP